MAPAEIAYAGDLGSLLAGADSLFVVGAVAALSSRYLELPPHSAVKGTLPARYPKNENYENL